MRQDHIHAMLRIVKREIRQWREPVVGVVARESDRNPFHILISCLLFFHPLTILQWLCAGAVFFTIYYEKAFKPAPATAPAPAPAFPVTVPGVPQYRTQI